jgi:hypothetical protein
MKPFNMAGPAALAILLLPGLANAQKPFAISDNSFLVEEAFNQEAGIFQNILVFNRASVRAFSLEFTQEWPIGSMKHQLSYTIPVEAFKPVAAGSFEYERGTIALNYRYQLLEESASQPAFSPRVSLLNTPDDWGFQVNLPLSKQFGDFYLHGNAGYTRIASAGAAHVAGSVIHRTAEMMHLMLESVFRADEYGDGLNSLILSPGVRVGRNFGDKQLVAGLAVPLGMLDLDDRKALLLYLSYELPFK